MQRTLTLRRARRVAGLELDFHERVVDPTGYQPVSAVTGGPFGRRVEFYLHLAARRYGCCSPHWATAHALHTHFGAAVLPGCEACGVGIGLGHGPLDVYNLAALEATDAHFLLQAHPLPDGLDTGDHLLLCDGRWQRHRHPKVRASLDRALSETPGMASPAAVAIAHSPNPRRWVDAAAVASRRASLLPGAAAVDAVGRGAMVLHNVEHCDRAAEITAFWQRAEASAQAAVPALAAPDGTTSTADADERPSCPGAAPGIPPSDADLDSVVAQFVSNCRGR